MNKIVSSVILLSFFAVFFNGSAMAEPLVGPSKQYDLLNAIEDKDVKKVLELLKNGVSPNTRTYTDGIPALVIAARAGNKEILEALLKAGARPDIATRDRRETALMIRSMARKPSMVQLLLEYKADPNKTDKANETSLIKAVRAKKVQNVQLLLDAGADPDIIDLTGRSALDYAQLNRSRRIVAMIEKSTQ